VIGNLGGIASNKEEIKRLTKQCSRVIFLYDNDVPGRDAMKHMNIGRPIYIPNFPEIDGMTEYDVNDMVKMGWNQKDFQNLFDKATLSVKETSDSLFLDRILFNRIK
jgi:DNA primase